ncbi:MAG: glycosyltransferase family 2 protein, partial [Planctomycetes bacterium]|nr:glycosyltransferase family 2 protein [Planctomycetota bacterium]
MHPLRLSVVLPTLDRPEAIYNLLRHLEHQSLAPHEIIVVDQSAVPDARVAAYAAGHPRIRFHRIAERGLPNARNVGVGLATGDAVLFLDDDSIPDPDLVRFHAQAYADPGVSGVGGRVQGGYDSGGAGVG